MAPPPHELELVIDFVNTLDPDEDSDELATTRQMAAWLAARGLLARRAPAPSEAERLQAVELRETLRALMLANNGGQPPAGGTSTLERVARQGELGVHFGEDSARVAPGVGGVAGALARLLVPVADALADGSWRRAKACRESTCQWAFYDRSRNRSGVWCDMAVCGNRTKVRAYRQRTPRAARD
jgi:predicted RNA-binding Zn ribbon-like protein